MSRERRAYRVIGRVQGVGFRWFTRQTATDLGLGGSVRNASDGTVEIVARGDAASLDELERRLADGPPLARVDELRVEQEADPPDSRPAHRGSRTPSEREDPHVQNDDDFVILR